MTPEIKQRIQQIRQGKTPKGYKKTIAGIIPNEWMEIALSSLLEFKNGYNTEKDNYGKGVKLISIKDILKDKPIYYDSIIGSVTISNEQLKEFAVNYGDILFQRSSETYEDAGTSNVYLDKEKVASFSGFVIRGRKIANYNPICLNSILRLGKIRNSIIRKAAGAQHINIGQEALSKVQIPLPPLPEQTAIAEILSTQDRVIELKEHLLAEKKRQKKYLMQQLLTGKKRLKGFKGEWKRCKLGEISHYVNIHGDGCVCNYVTTENIKPDLIGEVAFEEGNRKVSGINYLENDILIANIRPYLRKIWKSNKSGVCSTDVLVIRSDSVIVDYLYFALANDDFFDYVMKSAKGSKMPRGDKEHIMNRMIYVPDSLPEQTAIAEILSTADREIGLIGQLIEAEKRKKKSLMQLLLTGIVRVGGMTERLPGAS